MEEKDKQEVKKIVEETLKGFGKCIGDTPTDTLQLTPRKYVNLYASVSGLPTPSVIGQQVFLTDVGSPAFRRQDGKWVNGVGSVLA